MVTSNPLPGYQGLRRWEYVTITVREVNPEDDFFQVIVCARYTSCSEWRYNRAVETIQEAADIVRTIGAALTVWEYDDERTQSSWARTLDAMLTQLEEQPF